MQATHSYVTRPTCSLSPCGPAHTRPRQTPLLSRRQIPLCRSRAVARSGVLCDAAPRCLRQQQQRCSPPPCPNRMQRTAPPARARDGAGRCTPRWIGTDEGRRGHAHGGRYRHVGRQRGQLETERAARSSGSDGRQGQSQVSSFAFPPSMRESLPGCVSVPFSAALRRRNLAWKIAVEEGTTLGN